ncbi:hypothetical protein V6N13_081004 [Hibiscus sabdariffa]
MVGRRARKSICGAADDSTTKFPISGKVPLEWLMHRLASPSPGHAQSVCSLLGFFYRAKRLWCALAHCFLRSMIESFARVGCGPLGVDAATSTQWACEW